MTRSVDTRRSGANTHETSLKPGNVAQLKFLRELKIDADDDPRIEAQPLYIPAIQTDNRRHDLVVVCTMSNNVYAFDVGTGERILSTPVIDPGTNILYVVNWSSPDGTTNKASFHLNSLNLRDGKSAQPAIPITAASGTARFDPHLQKQRSALLLLETRPSGGGVRKTLLMACGLTHETATDHHGWIVAFDVGGNKMRRTAAFCTTPKSAGGVYGKPDKVLQPTPTALFM